MGRLILSDCDEICPSLYIQIEHTSGRIFRVTNEYPTVDESDLDTIA